MNVSFKLGRLRSFHKSKLIRVDHISENENFNIHLII